MGRSARSSAVVKITRIVIMRPVSAGVFPAGQDLIAPKHVRKVSTAWVASRNANATMEAVVDPLTVYVDVRQAGPDLNVEKVSVIQKPDDFI